MPGDLGREVGKVSIRVVPNTRDFGTDLRTQLAGMQRALKVTVDSELDQSGLNAGLADAAAQVHEFQGALDILVQTRVDTSGLKKGLAGVKTEVAATDLTIDANAKLNPVQVAGQLAEGQAVADADPIQVALEADNDLFANELKASLLRLHKSVNLVLPATVNAEQLRAEFANAAHVASQQFDEVIPLNFEDAARIRKKMIDALAQAQEVANKIGVKDLILPQLDQSKLIADLEQAQAIAAARAIGVDVDVKPRVDKVMIARVETELSTLERQLHIDVPLTLEGQKLLAEVQERIASLRAFTKLPVSMDLEDQLETRRQVVEQMAVLAAIAKELNPKVRIPAEVDIKGALEGLVELKALVDTVRIQKTIRTNVDTDPAERALLDLGLKFAATIGGLFGIRLATMSQLATQLVLISSRALAYTLLLGPPILLAASGATILASSFITLIPAIGAFVTGITVIGLALKNLKATPAFQSIISQVRILRGELAQLLVQGLDPVIAKLSVNFMPALSQGFKEVAVAINDTATQFLNFLSSTQGISQTRTILDGLAVSMSTLGRAVVPLFSSLQQITIAALPGFQLLSTAIAKASQHFAEMLSSASKSHALQAAITHAVFDLIDFSAAVGRISLQLFHLFQTLEPATRATFGAIGRLLSGLITSVDTAIQTLQAGPHQGLLDIVSLMSTLFNSAKAIGGALFNAFKPLFTNDQPGVLSHLIDIFENLIKLGTEFGTKLIGAFGAVARNIDVLLAPLDLLLRAFDKFTQFLVDNAGAIADIGLVITALFVPTLIGLGRQLITLGLQTDKALKAKKWITPFLEAIAPITNLVKALAGLGAAFIQVGVQAVAQKLNLAVVTTEVGAVATAMGTLKTAINGVKQAVRALFVTFLESGGVEFLIIATAIGVLIRTFDRLRAVAKPVGASADDILQHFDPTNWNNAKESIDAASRAMQFANDRAVEMNRHMNLAVQIWHTLFGGDTPQQWANLGKTYADAVNQMTEANTNFVINTDTFAPALGLTVEEVKQLAKDNDIDLTGGVLDKASQQFKQLADIVDSTQTGIGLSIFQIKQNVKDGAIGWEQYADAVKQAMDAASQAFLRDTAITNFDPAKGVQALRSAEKELTNAKNAQADAQRRVNQEQQRAHNTKGQTQADSFALVNAQDNLTDATNRRKQAEIDLARAQKGAKDSNFKTFLHDQLTEAQNFVRNINTLILDGLDPGVISQLLQAGPKAAAPVVKAILSGSAAANIALVNDTEKAMRRMNAAIIEDARLTNIAVQSKNDKLVKDLPLAQAIDQQELAHHGQLTLEQLIAALHLKPKDIAHIAQIADEFGISVKGHVKKAVDRDPPKIDVQTSADPNWQIELSNQFNNMQDALDQNPFMITIDADTSNLPASIQQAMSGRIIGPAPVIHHPHIVPPQTPQEFHRTHSGFGGLAGGGLVVGPGGPTSDVVPMWLSNLEFVQRAAAVRYYGVDLMHAINALMIPRTTLRMASGLDVKMASAQPPSLPSAVSHGGAARVAMEDHEHGFPGGTMVLVDADGNLIGRMRAAAMKSHRDRAQASRMANLGTWGRS